MKRVSYFLLISGFIGLFSLSLRGQTAAEKNKPDAGFAKKWRIGLSIGPDFYYGDLNASKFLPEKSISIAAGLFTEY